MGIFNNKNNSKEKHVSIIIPDTIGVEDEEGRLLRYICCNAFRKVNQHFNMQLWAGFVAFKKNIKDEILKDAWVPICFEIQSPGANLTTYSRNYFEQNQLLNMLKKIGLEEDITNLSHVNYNFLGRVIVTDERLIVITKEPPKPNLLNTLNLLDTELANKGIPVFTPSPMSEEEVDRYLEGNDKMPEIAKGMNIEEPDPFDEVKPIMGVTQAAKDRNKGPEPVAQPTTAQIVAETQPKPMATPIPQKDITKVATEEAPKEVKSMLEPVMIEQVTPIPQVVPVAQKVVEKPEPPKMQYSTLGGETTELNVSAASVPKPEVINNSTYVTNDPNAKIFKTDESFEVKEPVSDKVPETFVIKPEPDIDGESDEYEFVLTNLEDNTIIHLRNIVRKHDSAGVFVYFADIINVTKDETKIDLDNPRIYFTTPGKLSSIWYRSNFEQVAKTQMNAIWQLLSSKARVGKVGEITDIGGVSKDGVIFDYNTMGNGISHLIVTEIQRNVNLYKQK